MRQIIFTSRVCEEEISCSDPTKTSAEKKDFKVYVKYLSDIESRYRRTYAHPNSDQKPSQEHALKTLS